MKKTDISTQTLQYLGLSENEAILYLLMLSHPRGTAQELTKKSPFGRTLLYHILKSLEEKWLLKAKKEHWKTIYIPVGPEILGDILERKESEFLKKKTAIKKLIPELKQQFSLKNKAPSVRVIEGIQAYEKVLEECLEWKHSEMHMYEDLYPNKPALEIREQHEQRRVSKGIEKKVLFFEDPDALRELKKKWYNDYTLFRSLPEDTISPFEVDMMLWDGKILYIHFLSLYDVSAILIEDITLYEMQKNIFLSLWKNSKDRTLYFTET